MPDGLNESELVIVGAGVLDPGCIEVAAGLVTPEDFSSPRLRACFSALLELARRGAGVDHVLLRDQLRRQGDVALADDAMLVSELAGQVPSVANVTYHCELVADAARRRRVAALGADLLARAQSPAGETGGLVDDALQELIGLGAARNAASCDAVGLASAGVEAAVEGTRPGLPTGVADLDALLGGGLRGGELFVIGARPGAGKTTFALQVARHIAAHAAPAAVFSLEMSRAELGLKLLSATSGLDGSALRRGIRDKAQAARLHEAAKGLSSWPLTVWDGGSLTVTGLLAECRRLQRLGGLRAVVVDYLQLMSGERRARETTRLQEITDTTRGLKMVARELDVAVVALSQLNRTAVGDSSPRLSQLRESGSIEQDADAVLLLQEAGDGDGREIVRCHLAKQRNGPTGRFDLIFRKGTSSFEAAK